MYSYERGPEAWVIAWPLRVTRMGVCVLVRVSASAVEDLDDLELPRDPYKYKAKQPDPLRRGFRFSACNSKKHTVCFEKNRPQVPQSPTAQVQAKAKLVDPIAA